MKYKDSNQILNDVKRKISISNLLEEEKVDMVKSKKTIFKSIAVVCCTVLTVTGVVFAKDIGGFVSNIFGWTSGGVNTAVENGYVANVNTEFQESNDISVSVNSFLLDDDNFDITFDIKLGDKHKKFLDDFEVEYSKIDLKDLKIVNEERKKIFATDQGEEEERKKAYEEFEEYKKLGGTDKHDEIFEKYDLYSGGYSFGADKVGDNEFKYNITTTEVTESFPIAKKIIITFNKVQIYNSKDYKVAPWLLPDDDKCFTGEWRFEIDVPEQMINSRKPIIYKMQSCNDKKTKVDSTATLTNTAFKISIPETSTDKIDYDLLKVEPPQNIFDKIALGRAYVETSDGRKFESSGGDGGYSFNSKENKIENYSETFDLTKFDATDNLKVHIFTNSGKEIIIKYKKIK